MPDTASSVASSQPAKSGAEECPEPLGPIITAAIGILGAAAVALGVHALSKRREAVARFSAAAKEFRAAFTEELGTLESGVEAPLGIQAFLCAAYEKQLAAFSSFKYLLPEMQRASFTEAWQQYHSGQTIDGQRFDRMDYAMSHRQALFAEYGEIWEGIRTEPASTMAVKRIHALLDFAPHN